MATREDMLDHGQLWPLDSNSDPEEGGEPSGAPERVLLPPGPISSIPPPAAAQIEGDPIAQANPDMIPGGTTIKAIALAQTTPILINSKCSGYFLEPVSAPNFPPPPSPKISAHRPLVDGMDATLPAWWPHLGKNCLPDRVLQGQAGQLQLGGHALWLWAVGRPGEYAFFFFG